MYRSRSYGDSEFEMWGHFHSNRTVLSGRSKQQGWRMEEKFLRVGFIACLVLFAFAGKAWSYSDSNFSGTWSAFTVSSGETYEGWAYGPIISDGICLCLIPPAVVSRFNLQSCLQLCCSLSLFFILNSCMLSADIFSIASQSLL
jgi:hypothetical protein